MRFTGITGLFGLVWSRRWTVRSMLLRHLFWDIDPSPTGCTVIHFLLWGAARWCNHYKVLLSHMMLFITNKCVFVCLYILYLYVQMFCDCVSLRVAVYFCCLRVNSTSAVCWLSGPGIISHITKNKVLPCIQPALFHIPQESCNLFLPAHLPPHNPQCFLSLVLSLGYRTNIRKEATYINQ